MRAWHACITTAQQPSQRQMLRRMRCLERDIHLTVVHMMSFRVQAMSI